MNQALKSQALPLLDPKNDGRHVLRDLPLERESIPYVLPLPEQDIGTFIYTWVSKDHVAGSIFVVFGPAIGDTPIVEAVDGVAVDPSLNFDNWQVGKVSFRQDLKLQTAEVRAESDRVSLAVRFEASHPAYAYSFHADGCPAWAATDRLEQAGRITGALQIDGQSHAVDTMGARDHSWGTRDWYAPQHWKWLHAQAGPDCCVHFWKIDAMGETQLRGYVLRDGAFAEVTQVDIKFDHDEQWRQTGIDARVTDSLGRTTRVVGQFYGHFPLCPNPDITLFEGAMRCEIEGRPGSGWSEFMWPTGYLKHLQAM